MGTTAMTAAAGETRIPRDNLDENARVLPRFAPETPLALDVHPQDWWRGARAGRWCCGVSSWTKCLFLEASAACCVRCMPAILCAPLRGIAPPLSAASQSNGGWASSEPKVWEVADLSLQVEQQRRSHGLLGDCEPSPAHGEGEHRVPGG
jgi:hypothetical protein